MQHLIDQASDLYFAIRSDLSDAATKEETINDLNRFITKIARMVADGALGLKVAQALILKTIRPHEVGF